MMNNTIMYGIRKAPPPFSYATNGKRHTLPRPTETDMHDITNSRLLDHTGRFSHCWLDGGRRFACNFFLLYETSIKLKL